MHKKQLQTDYCHNFLSIIHCNSWQKSSISFFGGLFPFCPLQLLLIERVLVCIFMSGGERCEITFLPAKVTLRFLGNNEPLLSSPLPSSHPLFCEWKCSHSATIIKYEMLEVHRRQTLSGVWGHIDQMQVTTHQNFVIFKAFQGICVPLWLYITNS